MTIRSLVLLFASLLLLTRLSHAADPVEKATTEFDQDLRKLNHDLEQHADKMTIMADKEKLKLDKAALRNARKHEHAWVIQDEAKKPTP